MAARGSARGSLASSASLSDLASTLHSHSDGVLGDPARSKKTRFIVGSSSKVFGGFRRFSVAFGGFRGLLEVPGRPRMLPEAPRFFVDFRRPSSNFEVRVFLVMFRNFWASRALLVATARSPSKFWPERTPGWIRGSTSDPGTQTSSRREQKSRLGRYFAVSASRGPSAGPGTVN